MVNLRDASDIFRLIWMGSLFDENPELISEYQTKDQGFDGRLVNRGARLVKEWPRDFEVVVQGYRPVDYFLCDGFYSVVSSPVRQVIETMSKEDAEFLPIRVISLRSNREIGQYWVLNVTANIEALDWERTRWISDEVPHMAKDAYLNIIKPAFKLELIENRHMFLLRVGEHIRPGIYVSANLRRSLEANHATLGMDFMPIKTV